MQPSSPKVTITNLIFGNLKKMETRAFGIDGAPVHAYHTRSQCFPLEISKDTIAVMCRYIVSIKINSLTLRANVSYKVKLK